MTKPKMATWGWLYLTAVLDGYTKEIFGNSLGILSKKRLVTYTQSCRQHQVSQRHQRHSQRVTLSDLREQPPTLFRAFYAILGLKKSLVLGATFGLTNAPRLLNPQSLLTIGLSAATVIFSMNP